jgi:hypothetical protein
MTQQLPSQHAGVIDALVLGGDLSAMNNNQKVAYYTQFCHYLGLNPLTQPFRIMRFQGKEIMYATKDCTDQLRKRDDISIMDVHNELIEDVLYATVKGKNKEGRTDVEIGAVFIGGLRGEALANAHMKALTKGKRRLTLSLCGLGIPDESEIETIDANAVTVEFPKEKAKPTLTDKAFGNAVIRINKGEREVIGRLREDFTLSEDQQKILLGLEDQNVVPNEA